MPAADGGRYTTLHHFGKILRETYSCFRDSVPH